DIQALEPLAQLRDDLGLDAARRADEQHLEIGFAAPELLEDGDAREQVSPGAATCHDDALNHRAPPSSPALLDRALSCPRRWDSVCERTDLPFSVSSWSEGAADGSRGREMFRRIPTAAQFTSRDDPP